VSVSFTANELRAWLRYHLGLARLAIEAYPNKHDPFLALDSLSRELYRTLEENRRLRYLPDHIDDAMNVMNNGYRPGIYRKTINTWQRLRDLFVETPDLFEKYGIASQEEIQKLRKQMRLPD